MKLVRFQGPIVASAVVSLLALAAGSGCGGTVIPQDSTSSTASGGQGGHGGGGQGGGLPDTCTSSPVDHAAACSTDACPITVDINIHCTHAGFAFGVRVAPSADTTYAAATGDENARIFAVDAAGARAIDGFPLTLPQTPVSLAVAPNGTLHVVGDETIPDGGKSPPTYPGGLSAAALTNGTFTRTGVFDAPDHYIRLVDLDVAPDGTANTWFASDPPSGLSRGVLDEAGKKWVVTDAPVPANTDWSRFGLGTDGAPLSFGLPVGDGSHALQVRVAGKDLALGSSPVTQSAYTPLQAPAHPAAGIPAYGAVAQGDDGLHVVWPIDGGALETTLAASQGLKPVCSSGTYVPELIAPCPADCHETSVGVPAGAFAAARADSGDVWVAYVVVHRDEALHYTNSCNEEIGCFCGSKAHAVATTSELVVARLALDGTPAHVMAKLPLPGNSATAPALDARAFGEDVAIAIQVVTSTGIDMRVIRLAGPKS